MSGRMRRLEVRRLGVVGYAEALALQETLVVDRRENRICDQLLLLEHPHVITLGSTARREHVLLDAAARERMDVQLFQSGRGGDVTYHGPGQLVGYPILDLKPDRKDLHRYLRDLEGVLVAVLREFGIDGRRSDGFTGVWVGDRKIAAIGVRVSSGWIASHGFALNVATDLSYFSAIVPCGIHDREVTSLSEELGEPIRVHDVLPALERHFAERFEAEFNVASATIDAASQHPRGNAGSPEPIP